MGLHLNYELCLPGSASAAQAAAALARLRAAALGMRLGTVSGMYDARAAGLRRLATVIATALRDERPDLLPDAGSALGFSLLPGDGCETALLALMRRTDERGRCQDWYWHWSCKTQYASVFGDRHLVACHTRLVRLLDHAIEIGVNVVVRDEAHYWETRDEARLIAEVRAMNRVVARLAGRLGDLSVAGGRVDAPIFRHPRFERLEMGLDDAG
jgi:hypothetical protein